MSSTSLNNRYNLDMLIIFGKRLKDCRRDANMTQAQLAAMLNVSKTTICQWETHKQEPSLEDVVSIARIFQVSANYLLGVAEDDI